MKLRKLFACITAIVFALTSLPLSALAAEGDIHEATLYPIDNAWTQANAPDTVEDNSSYLLISGIGAGKPAATRRHAYLKFDLAEINYSSITSATLNWYTNKFSNKTTRVTNIYSMTEKESLSWSGDSVTWGSAPDYDVSNSDYDGVEPIGTLSQAYQSTPAWGSVDLTEYFKTVEPDRTEISFAITLDTGASYISSIGTGDGNAPYLQITYAEGDGQSSIARSDVTIKTVDNNGTPLLPETVEKDLVAGRTYSYTQPIEQILSLDNTLYQFNREESSLSALIEDGAEIILKYDRITPDENGLLTAKVFAVDSGNTNSAEPDAVQSNNPTILTSSDSGSAATKADRSAFLKFDLSILNAEIVAGATLGLYMTSSTNAGTRTVSVYNTSNEWDSSALVFGNAPEPDGSEIANTTFPNGQYGWLEFDVFKGLSMFDGTEKEISFRIETDTGANYFTSHFDTEGFAPYLSLTFEQSSGAPRETRDVRIRTVDENGSDIAPVVTEEIAVGKTYFYDGEIPDLAEKDGVYYQYDKSRAVLSLSVSEDGENEILITYNSLPDGTISSARVRTVTADGTPLEEEIIQDKLWSGEKYFHNTVPVWVREVDGVLYGYSDSFSNRVITVSPDREDNLITILYKPLTTEPTGSQKSASAPLIDSAWAIESAPDSAKSTGDSIDVSSNTLPDWSSSTAAVALENRAGLLKFDLANISYEKIKSAKLVLGVNTASNKGTRTIYAYGVSSAWSGGDVTWNTLPLVSGEMPDCAAGSVTLERMTAFGTAEIDVTPFVENLVGGETEVSLLLRADTASVNLAVTGENAPYLEIEYYEGAATEASKGTVILRQIDAYGNKIAEDSVLTDEVAGREYTYAQTPAPIIKAENGNVYSFSAEESALSVTVAPDTENYIVLVYRQIPIYPGEEAEVSVSSADSAFVVENAASTVQDNSSKIQITGVEGAGKSKTNRHGLVKFDTSFIDASKIESAYLSFNVTSATNTGERTLTFYACGNDWSSSSACWNNAPSYDSAAPLGSVKIAQSAVGSYGIDLTEYIESIKESLSEGISFRITADTAVTELPPAGAENAMRLDIKYTASGEAQEKQYMPVTVTLEDADGGIIEESVEQGILGREFAVTPSEKFEKNGFVYIYRPKLSVESIIVSEGENAISLVYKAYEADKFYTDTIIVSENAWINESDAKLVTSNDEGLLVSSSGGGDPALANRDILLKFDMNYINFSEIVTAKLMFFVDKSTNSASRATLCYPVSSDWEQGFVSWSSAPTYKSSSLLGSVSFSGGSAGWYEIDLTEYMTENITNSTGDLSLRLAVDTACNYIAPLEKGEGTAPKLVVSYLDDGSVSRQNVLLRVTDPDGNKLEEDSVYMENVPVGREVKYEGAPDTFRTYNGENYVYAASLSETRTTVIAGENIITLVYAKETSGEELTVEFEVSQNAYTNDAAPDSVQDHSSYLLATRAAGSSPALSTRDTFLKFDIAQISFSEIISAKLKFYVNKTGNETGRTITAALSDAGWDESTLTWSNAPEKGENAGSVTFNHNATGWYEIDLSDALKTIDGETVDISVCLSADTASSYITSLEAGDGMAPKLEITYKNDGTGAVRERRGVYLSTEDENGNPLAERITLSEGEIVGSTYVYKITPDPYIKDEGGTNYMFDSEKSNLSVKVTQDGDNTVRLVYVKSAYSGDIVSKTAVAADNGFTNSAQPSAVQSASSYLLTSGMAGSQGANSSRDTFIKFVLPSDEYRYSKIISAKLKLYVQQATNNTSRTTDIYLIEDNSWSGSSVTWDNAPSFGESGYLGSMTFANGTSGWKELDITEQLSTMDYTDTLSIAMRTDTAANYWGSIAGGQGAALELTYIEGDPVYYERSSVTVRTADEAGNLLKPDVKISKLAVGTTYTYSKAPDASVTVGSNIYSYKPESSQLSVTVTGDEENNIIMLIYSLVSPEDIFSGYEISPEGSYCWFADDRAVHYENEDGTVNMTYVGYIDVHGSIKATQYNHLTGEVSEVLIRSNFQPDDHDNPAFLALPDGHIMIIYSRHTDEKAFYYRVSQIPGDITALGEEKKLATSANTTYPNPFILSDDPEHIYMCWRGTNWHPTMAQLTMPSAENGYTLAFTYGPKQIVSSSAQSSGCRPYAKYTTNGKDTIHMTYSATHPDNIYPVSLYYNAIKITDFTEGNVQLEVKGAEGNTLATQLPFKVNNSETDPSFVVDDKNTSQRGWVWQIELDKNSNPVIAMVRISSDKKLHTYYYAKWDPESSGWIKTKLDDAGGAFHLSSSEQCYSGGMTIDPENTNIIYGSVPVEGIFGKVFEIIRYTMSDDGKTVLKREQVTRNSAKNNVRPFSIPGAEGDNGFDLIWLNGDYWFWIVNQSYPNGFPTAVRTNFDFGENGFDSDKNLISFSESDTKLRTLGENIISSDSFTISGFVNFSASENWGGTPFDFGGGKLKYEVNTSSYIPTLTIGGGSFQSTNLWSNSDWNKTHSATTDGSTGTTNPGKVHLAVTYDAETGIAKTYINGMADQYIELAPGALDLSGANTVCNLTGEMSGFRIYGEALTSSEIKALMSCAEEQPSRIKLSASLDGEAKIVTADITCEDPVSAILYAALYSADGALLETKSKKCEITGSESVSLTLDSSLPEDGTVKVFLWDENARPLADSVTVMK